MKKLFALVALAGLGLAWVGCDQPTTTPKPVDTKADTTKPADPDSPPPPAPDGKNP
jgi:hypothetical protein